MLKPIKNLTTILFISLCLCCTKALADDRNKSIQKGQQLFGYHCSNCHELPDPDSKSWNEWINIMVAMGHMAKLEEGDRSLILEYLVSRYIANAPISKSVTKPVNTQK